MFLINNLISSTTIPLLLILGLGLLQCTQSEHPNSSISNNYQEFPFPTWSHQELKNLQDTHEYQSHFDKIEDTNPHNNDIIAFLGHHFIDSPTTSTTTSEPDIPPPPPIPLPVVNRPLQVSLLAVIMTAAVLANGSVILNISRDSLKLRMVHFLLIRHVCITDMLGALLVLPVPLMAVLKGNWDFGDNMCSAVSTTTAACWTMHLLAVAFYRADRVLAVWLPTGRYPIFSVRTTNILLVIVWCVAVSGSYGATIIFRPTFQPALALCIPDVPLIFFVIVFAGYCIGLVGLTTGYVLAFARRRRRKRKKERQSRAKSYPELQDNAPFEPTPSDYIDDDIEDFEDNNSSSSKGRKRRALSDQYAVLNLKPNNAKEKESPYCHRRTWSESATTYRPSTIFTTLVTKVHRHSSTEKSPSHLSNRNAVPMDIPPTLPDSTMVIHREDSSSDNLTITSTNGYQRLTEDEVSSSSSPSEASTTVPKLVHSISFDERGLYNSKPMEDLFLQNRVLVTHQSKSFDSTDCCRSAKPKGIRSLKSNFLSKPITQIRQGNSNVINCSSFVHIPIMHTSQLDIYSSDLLISPGQVSETIKSQCPSSEEISSDLPPSHIILPNPQTENLGNHSYTISTYPGPSHKIKSKEKPDINNYMSGVYAWSLDRKNVLLRKNSTGDAVNPSGDNPCFGGSETSSGGDSSFQKVPAEGGVDEKTRPAHTIVLLTPNNVVPGGKNHISLSVSVNSLSLCGDGRPPEASSLNSRAVSENNLQVKPIRKHRTRTRVKHFRAKGNKSGPAKRALASYAVSVGHLLLYLPAMFVVGLQGSSLPPGVALFCGIVVYCDFLIQPIALLLVSHRLRIEVERTIASLFGKGKSSR